MSAQLEALRRHVAPRAATSTPLPERGAVVVGGGKGGVGTSTVAALLALLAAAEGTRTLLVDADETLGALALLLGAQPAAGWPALRGGGEAERRLHSLSPALDLLPGGGAGDAPFSPVERRTLFRRVGALYGGYELVVVDGGSRLDALLAACDAGLGRLLLVAAPERIALAATHALAKAVEARHAGCAIEVLVNRADEASGARAFRELSLAAERFLARGLEYAGAVPDDDCLHAGVAAGMSVQDAADGSPAATVLYAVARRLVTSVGAAAAVAPHIPQPLG